MAKALMGQPDPYEGMYGKPPEGNVAGSLLNIGKAAGPPLAAFAHGGLSGLATQQGIDQPDWSKQVGQTLSSPEANAAFGIFAGPTAKTADLAALEMAKNLQKQGLSRSKIRNQTGWFQGQDQGWRFEVPDETSSMQAVGPDKLSQGQEQPLGNLLHHPDAYEAYPHLHTLPVDANPEGFTAISRGGSIGIDPKMSADQTRSALLHEMQHEIQRKEGFMSGRGPYDLVSPVKKQAQQMYDAHDTLLHARRGLGLSSMDDLSTLPPDQFTKAIASGHEAASNYWGRQMDSGLLSDALLSARTPSQRQDLITSIKKSYEDMPTKVKEAEQAQDQDNSHYYHQASEVEARNVQKRRDYTPEQRKFRAPWNTQDIKPQFQNTTPTNVIPDYVKALRGY